MYAFSLVFCVFSDMLKLFLSHMENDDTFILYIIREVPHPHYVQETLLFVWRSMADGWSQTYKKFSYSLLQA